MYQNFIIRSNIDEAWDRKMRIKDKDFMCGIENKYKKLTKSRVINGRLTNNIRYPWLVEHIRVFYTSDGKTKQAGRCGGTIVSDKSYLTAAHCVCVSHKTIAATCLEDTDHPQNQNRPDNFLHYTFEQTYQSIYSQV